MRKWKDLSPSDQDAWEYHLFENACRSPLSDFVRISDLEPIMGPELFRDFLLTYEKDCSKWGTYLGEFALGDKEQEEFVCVIYSLHYDYVPNWAVRWGAEAVDLYRYLVEENKGQRCHKHWKTA